MMDELEEELRHNDRIEFAGRLARLKEVVAWFDLPETGLALGPDLEAGQSFQEARFAYVNGFWMSAIVMAHASIERHIAWRLTQMGVNGAENMTGKALEENALSRGLVTCGQAAAFGRLRRIRNDFAHYRINSRFLATLWFALEAVADDAESEGIDVNLVLQADAKEAVQTATAYFLAAGTGL